MRSKEVGADKVGADVEDEVIYKIDVPANRCATCFWTGRQWTPGCYSIQSA